MADHFVAVARGVSGTKYSDFTVGTSSAATALFEFRVLDGVSPRKTEVQLAIKALERFFENAQQTAAAGFDIKG
jgi:hypothetical protein